MGRGDAVRARGAVLGGRWDRGSDVGRSFLVGACRGWLDIGLMPGRTVEAEEDGVRLVERGDQVVTVQGARRAVGRWFDGVVGRALGGVGYGG